MYAAAVRILNGGTGACIGVHERRAGGPLDDLTRRHLGLDPIPTAPYLPGPRAGRHGAAPRGELRGDCKVGDP